MARVVVCLVACAACLRAPGDMVAIDAATFEMGTRTEDVPALLQRYHTTHADLFASEVPRRTVTLAAFAIDRTEFVKDGVPLTNVTWAEASAACAAAGKRLPTEAEWEYAARGGLADPEFPWGDAPADKTRANYGATQAVAPCRYPPNGYGLCDMAGNVWEFTSDRWPSAEERYVIRGGSYAGAPVNLRVHFRDSHRANDPKPYVGFRCARSR